MVGAGNQILFQAQTFVFLKAHSDDFYAGLLEKFQGLST
jgi:hypothetical protein